MSRELKHILIVAGVIVSVAMARCANVMAPTGGPKDSLPPVVKLITPPNGTRNFTEKRIFVEFDEYVQLKDQSKEFFTSPLMKTKPVLTIREKGIRIDIKDTLLPDQTYSLNFGNSIRDNNEGNPLYGFRYVFSTGPAIDSMIMTGYTADASKGDSVSKAYIFFFDTLSYSAPLPLLDSLLADSLGARGDSLSADSLLADSLGIRALSADSLGMLDTLPVDSIRVDSLAVDSLRADTLPKPRPYITAEYDSLMFLAKPGVVARAEGNGIFIAQNLKDIPYRIYALQDNNGNQMYDPGVDKIGFADTLYNPADPSLPPFAIWLDQYRHYPTADPQLYFRLFSETPKKRQNLTGSERPGRHQAVLRFSSAFPQIDTLRFDSIPDDKVIREYQTVGRDTISLWFNVPPEALPDTIKGRISYLRTDSLGVLAPYSQDLKLAWRLVETREEEREREKEERDRQRAEEAGEEYVPPEKPNPFGFKVDAGAEVNPEKGIPIEFDLPLTEIDSMGISLTSRPLEPTGAAAARPGAAQQPPPQEVERTPVSFHLIRDTMNIRKWTITSDWDEERQYSLMIPAGVFTNVAGERNDTLKADFKIAPRSSFATLIVNVHGKNPNAKYIMEVVGQSGNVEKRIRDVSSGIYTLQYIPEGEVRVRLTEDGNGNGKWDTGSLVEHRQPERVEFYVGPTGNQLIPTRMNWEIDLEIDMATVFAPVSIDKIRLDLQKAEDARVTKYLEEKAVRDAERKKQEEQGGNGGGSLGIGSAMGSAKQQVQSTF